MKWRWLLAVIAVGSLVAYGTVLWWFGPYYATRALGLWMLLCAPLLFVSYALTRARWMVHAGYILIPLGMIASVASFPDWLDTDSPIPSIIGLVCAVPFMLTAAWALSVFQGPTRQGALRSGVRNAGPVCVSALAIVALTMWAAQEEPGAMLAMPQYADRFVGCYELSFSRWIPGGADARRALAFFAVPEHLLLDTNTAGARVIRPGSRWWGRGTWTPLGSGHVVASWNDGFSGMELSLDRTGRGHLHGRARVYTDADGFWPQPQALATLRPEVCSRVSADDSLRSTRGWTVYIR